MILTEEVLVKTTNQTQSYYKNLGYNFNCYDYIIVKISDLSKGSHYLVDILCDYCNKKYQYQFRGIHKYITEKYECKSCKSKRLISEGIRKKFNKETNIKIGENLKLKLQNPEFKLEYLNKRKYIKKIIYNDENFNNKEKRKETLNSKYGDVNYNNSQKRLDTLVSKYGFYYNNQSKKMETVFNKYGVYHTNHVYGIFMKIQKSSFKLKIHEKTNLEYRGSYEKDFLDLCFDKNIKISNFKGSIPYFFDKNRRYYPDFYFEELKLIIEIKSTYTYKNQEDINQLKRISSMEHGYNFIFIIDKKYEDFINMVLT